MCVTQLACDMQGERALTVSTPELQSKMNDQHALEQAAQHTQVLDTAELIRRHAAEQECSPSMCILIKNLTGKTIMLKVDPSWDIVALKRLVQIVEGIPVDDITLIHAGKLLEDKYQLTKYHIGREDTLYVHYKFRRVTSLVLCRFPNDFAKS